MKLCNPSMDGHYHRMLVRCQQISTASLIMIFRLCVMLCQLYWYFKLLTWLTPSIIESSIVSRIFEPWQHNCSVISLWFWTVYALFLLNWYGGIIMDLLSCNSWQGRIWGACSPRKFLNFHVSVDQFWCILRAIPLSTAFHIVWLTHNAAAVYYTVITV